MDLRETFGLKVGVGGEASLAAMGHGYLGQGTEMVGWLGGR